MMKTAQSFSISKEERFKVPTKKSVEASPGTYNSLNHNFNSSYTKAASTVFSKGNYSVIDKHFRTTKHDIQSPGPGAYNRFSEFSGMEINKSHPMKAK